MAAGNHQDIPQPRIFLHHRQRTGGQARLASRSDGVQQMIGSAEPQSITLQPGQRFYCGWPWETVTLMSDGTIVCGCADPFKKRPAGNAAILTIREIWNGPVFR